jgi:hypothetical protein
MWAFGNCTCVSNVEEHLTRWDSCVATTFEHEYVSGPNDQRPVLAKLEYVGWLEEILELNYRVLNVVVSLCNWVKANYIGSSATVKRDEYGFTFVNFVSLNPIYDQSFAFPLHVDQMFFSSNPKERGWKMVLKKKQYGTLQSLICLG